MHTYRWGVVVLAFLASATQVCGQPAQPTKFPPQAGVRGGLPLPEEDFFTITTNTTERYSVGPYKLYDSPRSTRPEIAAIELVRPPGDPPRTLPDSFILTTTDLVGATTLVLPLVEPGKPPFERRVELLVIDEISTSYKTYLETAIKRMFPTTSVTVLVANSQTAVVQGYVDKAELVQPIIDLVQGFLAAREGADPASVTVVNAIRVTGAQLVQLRVMIIEVNRSKTRQFSFNYSWQDADPNGVVSVLNMLLPGVDGALGTASSLVNAATFPAIGPTAGTGQSFAVVRPNQFALQVFVQAVVQNSLGKILAEPILVAESGQPAFFNVGGEFPITVPQGNQTLSVEFREFGTNLRFVPTVLGNGRIRMEVRPEVSAILDPQALVLPGGGSIPSFSQRVTETTVELENGQTMAIAGLVDQRVTAIANKVPFFGDLPLVGFAFQNKSYEQSETELLILVTPHLVDAMDQRPCKLPGRESRIPNDMEWYIGSKFEPPCFRDPYRDPIHRHLEKRPDPRPEPVLPYDNYGNPIGMEYTGGTAVRAPSMPAPDVEPQTLPPVMPQQGREPSLERPQDSRENATPPAAEPATESPRGSAFVPAEPFEPHAYEPGFLTLARQAQLDAMQRSMSEPPIVGSLGVSPTQPSSRLAAKPLGGTCVPQGN